MALPGMMTGQILTGGEPAQTVRYQLLIMFLIAGATGLGATGAVLGGDLRLTDGRHQGCASTAGRGAEPGART